MSVFNSFKMRGTAMFVALFVAALVVFSQAHVYAADGDATAPAATAPADTGIAAKTTKEVDNPYGIDALWAQGDFVSRGTLFTLAIMSLSTWYVMITKAVSQTLFQNKAKAANRTFWKGTAAEGLKTLDKKTAFYFLAADGLEAIDQHTGPLAEKVDLITWVQIKSHHAVEQVLAEMQSGLAVLATVGSIAPFVGLFGTVWGIYHALTGIAMAGQASIDKVAGPVGEALVMTALGLFTAVPAVLAYNWLVRRNKASSEVVKAFAHDLTTLILNNGRTAASRG